MNVPFAPVRGLIGTDYLRIRPDFLTIANPYDPAEPIAVVPAIAPDVAVFHGLEGDRRGNVLTSGSVDARLIAQAARTAIATVERLSEDDLAGRPHTGTLVPGIHVAAVAHVPRGAHPTGCEPCYGDDAEHIREYLRLAATVEGIQAYLARHVLGTRDHAEYLARAAAGPVGAVA